MDSWNTFALCIGLLFGAAAGFGWRIGFVTNNDWRFVFGFGCGIQLCLLCSNMEHQRNLFTYSACVCAIIALAVPVRWQGRWWLPFRQACVA